MTNAIPLGPLPAMIIVMFGMLQKVMITVFVQGSDREIVYHDREMQNIINPISVLFASTMRFHPAYSPHRTTKHQPYERQGRYRIAIQRRRGNSTGLRNTNTMKGNADTESPSNDAEENPSSGVEDEANSKCWREAAETMVEVEQTIYICHRLRCKRERNGAWKSTDPDRNHQS